MVAGVFLLGSELARLRPLGEARTFNGAMLQVPSPPCLGAPIAQTHPPTYFPTHTHTPQPTPTSISYHGSSRESLRATDGWMDGLSDRRHRETPPLRSRRGWVP